MPFGAGESAKSPGKSLELVAISGILSPAKVIAYAWGDMVTDVIARFRAISLLGVAKLGFRDIMGCCMI